MLKVVNYNILFVYLSFFTCCGAQPSDSIIGEFIIRPMDVLKEDIENPSFRGILSPVDSTANYRVPPSFYGLSYQIYQFELGHLFPLAYDKMNFSALSVDQPRSIFVVFRSDHVLVRQDENLDRDFTNDEERKLNYDSWHHLSVYEHQAATQRTQVFPFALRISPTAVGNYRVEYASLLRFTARITTPSDTLPIILAVDPWRTRFTRHREGQRQIRGAYFFLHEPFEWNDDLYAITELDVERERITVTRYKNDAIAYGYREGYTVDVEELRRLSTQAFEPDWTWRKANYYLLHFWGPWCFPCRRELPSLMRLRDSLNASGEVQLINYAVFMTAEDKPVFERLYQDSSLTSPQIIQPSVGEAADELPFRRARSAKNLFKIDQYPTYVLIDSEGTILLRTTGANKYREILAYLSQRL